MSADFRIRIRHVGIALLVLLALSVSGVGSVSASPSDASIDIDGNGTVDDSVEETRTYILVLEDDMAIEATTQDEIDRVRSHTEAVQQPVVDRLERMGVTVDERYWITNVMTTTVSPSAVSRSELESVPGIKRVERSVEYDHPQPIDRTTVTTADHDGTVTYGLDQIDVPNFVETFGTNGSDTRVAVLDDGLDPSHPDIDVALGVNVTGGVVSDPAQTTLVRSSGHGNHVAGTATGTATPAGDVPRYSVAPDAELLKADVFVGGAAVEDVIAGIQWAVENDADVVSISLGISSNDGNSAIVPSVEDAVRNANDAGTFVVTASGNDRVDDDDAPVTSPGSEFSSYSVGAVNEQREATSFSSGARISPDTVTVLEDETIGGEYPDRYPHSYVKPDVTAPGQSILSAGPLGSVAAESPTYSYSSGTSMATPHVAGAAALVQSATPTRHSPHVIGNALAETAEMPTDASTTPRDTRYGAGIINVTAATLALGETTTIEGAVTGSGEPLTGAKITTDSGVVSASYNGEYGIEPTTSAETVRVTADEFGFVPETRTVPTGGSETEDFDLAEIESIHVETDDDRISPGDTTSMSVNAETADGTRIDITDEADVTSSNTSVVTVGFGTLSAHDLGETTITAEYDGFGDSLDLSVIELEGIEFTVDDQRNEATVSEGETVGYRINATYSDGTTESITDTVTPEFAPDQDETALTIDTDLNTITGIQPATNVTVTVEDGPFSDSIDITVTETPLDTIALELSDTELLVGENTTATTTATFSNGFERDVTTEAELSATDPVLVSINNGQITGEEIGRTDITTTFRNETDTAALTITDEASAGTVVEYYTADDGRILITDAVVDFRAKRGAFAPDAPRTGSITDVVVAFRS